MPKTGLKLNLYQELINMLHRISDLCKKIDSIKTVSDRLYNLKYNNPKTPERDIEVNNLIEDIQMQCRLIANDKSKYDR